MSLVALTLCALNSHAANTPNSADGATTESNFFKGSAAANDSSVKVRLGEVDTSIYNLSSAVTQDGATEIKVYFDNLPVLPKARMLSNPDRLELNFGNLSLNLKKNLSLDKTKQVKGLTYLKNNKNEVMLVINLDKHGRLTTRQDGNAFILKVYPDDSVAVAATQVMQQNSGASKISFNKSVGQDQVSIDLASSDTPIDVKQVGNKVVMKFLGNPFANNLLQTKKITEPASIVNDIKVYNDGRTGIVEIASNGSFDFMVYQVDKKINVNFTRKQTMTQQSDKAAKPKFSGRKLNMDFQNVEIRKILQLLAGYAGVNIVASDNVNGYISIKLQDVPWDQALSIIAKSKNLAERKDGAIIWVAPMDEVTKYEEGEAKAYAQSVALAPLKTEFIQLNYATASDVGALIKPSSNDSIMKIDTNKQYLRSMNINGDESGSLLSPRGTVSVDVRTNTVIINDTAQKIEQIRKVIEKIDIPVRQVMIQARIVHASTDFSKALGVKWGFQKNGVVASDMTNLSTLYNNKFNGKDNVLDKNVNLDLSQAVSAIGTSSIALGLISTANTLLALELSALQAEGLGEVLSSPKILTGDKQAAKIRSGTKIPYQTTSGNNGTTTTFQDAVLELNVTPSITPDGNVQMKLEISKDTMGALTNAGYVIDTNNLTTNVLVGDNETVVLGGLYEDTSINSSSKVPLLGDVPALGKLFRSKGNTRKKQELLIFITPKIIVNPKI